MAVSHLFFDEFEITEARFGLISQRVAAIPQYLAMCMRLYALVRPANCIRCRDVYASVLRYREFPSY